VSDNFPHILLQSTSERYAEGDKESIRTAPKFSLEELILFKIDCGGSSSPNTHKRNGGLGLRN
jgi:hypothetical protein